MSVTNFFATKWSTILLQNYNRKAVFVDLMNRDYEGDAKLGGTVKISSIGRVTIKDYTRNSGAGGTAASPTIAGIDRPEVLQGSSLFLTIDQSKYFNFEAGDDLDKVQETPNLMSEAMKEAAYGLANAADLYANSVLQTGVAGTGDGNGNRLDARTIGTGPGDADAYETLVDLVTLLEEADVNGNFWAVIPPWYYGMLRKDERFVGNGTPGNLATLANGKIGSTVSGLDIRVSNNLSGATSGTLAVKGGIYTILVGVRAAAAFADALNDVEGFRPPDGRMDAVKGFHDYGSKVLRPYALASCACTKA